jgi:uncharacterized protein YjeT (DUF2065 family)
VILVLVKLIGVYITVMGAIFLFSPKSIKGYVAFWQDGKRLFIIGGSRILMGVILLLAVSQCKLKSVVFALGILTILAGLPYFLVSLDRQKTLTRRWQNKPPIRVRILGLLLLAVGVLLIQSV